MDKVLWVVGKSFMFLSLCNVIMFGNKDIVGKKCITLTPLITDHSKL